MKMIKEGIVFLCESEHFFVIIKPRGLHTSFLEKNQKKNVLNESLIEKIFFQFPEVKYIKSRRKEEGGLLHRLDKDTEGLILIARTQEFYNTIRDQASKHLFKKRYLACCFRIPAQCVPSGYTLQKWEEELCNFSQGSYFFHCSFVKAEAKSSRVRPIQIGRTLNMKTTYQTYIRLSQKENYIQAFCETTRGFRHQIRSSLSSLGLPIFGDPFYPERKTCHKKFSFWAIGLSFLKPGTYKRVNFTYLPDDLSQFLVTKNKDPISQI